MWVSVAFLSHFSLQLRSKLLLEWCERAKGSHFRIVSAWNIAWHNDLWKKTTFLKEYERVSFSFSSTSAITSTRSSSHWQGSETQVEAQQSGRCHGGQAHLVLLSSAFAKRIIFRQGQVLIRSCCSAVIVKCLQLLNVYFPPADHSNNNSARQRQSLKRFPRISLAPTDWACWTLS